MDFRLITILEAILIVIILIGFFIFRSARKKRVKSYIETVAYNSDSAKNHTLMNFPLPISVFRIEDSKIIWANEYYFAIAGFDGSRLDAKISDLIPSFSAKWLMEGKTQYPGVLELSGRKFKILGNIIRPEKVDETNAYLGITYWFDITEYDELRIKYENTRPIIAVVAIDNLDELNKNQNEKVKNDVREAIEDKLDEWVSHYSGIIRRYDRDRYIAFFDKKSLEAMKEEKFSITELIHNIHSPNGISASVSLGFSDETDSLPEALSFADLALELALTRGGDQTVVKNKLNYFFYGGRGTEVEKRTKVKSRVYANTLCGLIKDSSKVIVMGHKIADFDSLGACVGVCVLCRKLGIKHHILIKDDNVAKPLYEHLVHHSLYKNAFISPHEAMIQSDGRTLLVVVDTNKPEQVEDIDLLESINRVAIIDHHRVSSSYVQNAALGFIEPYASSSCELISEVLEDKLDSGDIEPFEADALLCGIVLDTKNFTLRTGERTFSSAAYLKKCGADPTTVKKLLQFDISDTVAKYKILETAMLYRNIAIAAPDEPQTRFVAASAADDMLNIQGVEASIVIAKGENGGVFASARSIGELNVQIIMEKLGGGGNKSAAAAQFVDMSLSEAVDKVYNAIDDYLGD